MTASTPIRLGLIGLIGLVGLAGLVGRAAASAATSTGADERDLGAPSRPTYRLRVEADATGRDWLSANGYDIAGHDLARDRVEVITDEPGLARMERRGLGVEILEVRTAPRSLAGTEAARAGESAQPPLPDTRYTDPGELEAFLQQVATDHPGITRLEQIGTSHQGRAIWAMLVSDHASADEDELAVLLSGAHHAREVMTPEVVMDAIDYLTDNYGSDPDVTAKVDAHQIWCVPMVNPDGVHRVHTVDDFWRKNTRDNDDNGVIDAFDGVDLNRNYEWGWGNQCQGSSDLIFSETYRGPTEGSEPETRAMVALGRRIRPVFDVEYHSYGEDVFYAASCDPDLHSPTLSTITGGSDQSISRVIAEDYAAEIVQADGGQGFSPAPYGSRVDGVGRDHQYHENGAIAFVTEVNSSAEGGFHPDYDTWRDATVEGQRPGWLWLLDRISGPAIGGKVVDAVTGVPLDADVALDEMSLPDGKRLTSRADTGRFHLIVVPGDYTLRVSAPGYEEAAVPLTVGSVWSPVQVSLQPTGSALVMLEDFEDPLGDPDWTAGDASDTALDGVWTWGEPEGTHSGSAQGADLEFGNARFDRTPGPGKSAFVTGNAAGAAFDSDDVDGGITSLVSPELDLSGLYGVAVTWHRWFRKDASDPPDAMETEVSDDGGGTWVPVDSLAESTSTPDASPAWTSARFRLDDFLAPGESIRLRFRVSDSGPDDTVEAAIDDVEIRGYSLDTQGEVRGVRVDDPDSTVVEWEPVPGGEGAVYDVTRGDLSALVGDGSGGVDLGMLACIEEDSIDTTTAGDPDTETPAAGRGWFYLVRFQLGFTTGGWGTSSQDGERHGTGGCAP